MCLRSLDCFLPGRYADDVIEAFEAELRKSQQDQRFRRLMELVSLVMRRQSI